MLACHAMLFLGGGHSVLLQHCGQFARRAVRLQTCCSVVMVVGDGVGIETLPGWYDTPVQEAGIAWPPCVTNTNKTLTRQLSDEQATDSLM